MIRSITPYRIYNPTFTAKQKTNKEYLDITVDMTPFSSETLNTLINDWAEQGLLEEGDSVIIIPKQKLEEAATIDKKIAKTLPLAKLSNNGFAAAILEPDYRINTKALQYFDPRINTMLKLVHQIKNNNIFIIPVEALYYDD